MTAARFVSDENKKVASLIGLTIGLAATMGLNISADKKIEQESRKDETQKLERLDSPSIEYRTDHADRIKSEPKQKSSLNL